MELQSDVFALLLLRFVVVAVNEYKKNPYHKFDEPFVCNDPIPGRLRFAITMKHSDPLHTVDEPRPSNAGAEAEAETEVLQLLLEICKPL